MVTDRFWAKVAIGTRRTCWRWLASLDGKGYGRFAIRYGKVVRSHRAHRYAFELLRGTILDGLEPDHLCRHRWCVNPWHLELVTHRTNMLRGSGFVAVNATRTHCPRGHPYDAANTRHHTDRRGRIHRDCRTCQRQRAHS